MFNNVILTSLLIFRDRLGSFSLQESQRFDELDLRTKQIATLLLDTRPFVNDDTGSRIENRITALSQLLNRLEVVLRPLEDPNKEKMSAVSLEEPKEKGVIVNVSAPLDLSSRPSNELLTIEKVRDEEKIINNRVVKSITKSLWFSNIRDRAESLTEAHKNTFDWIFHTKTDAGTEVPWSNFVDWLQNGEGIYWINGRAGSGK